MSEHALSSGMEEAISPEATVEPVPSVGQQLRTAREARGLSVSDAARTLKLSNRQVEALENDDWAQLPGNTIVRGFVRNYARFLELDASALMRELDRREVSLVPDLDIPTGTNVRVPQGGQVERRDYFRVMVGVVALLLALLAYFFVPPELWHTTLSALKSATQSGNDVVKKTAVAAPEVMPPSADNVPTTPTQATESPASAPQAAAAVAVPQVPGGIAANGDENAFRFNFSEPSWVEIRDRSSEVVFSELCQIGPRQIAGGQPPFSLVVGNASGVTLSYKGKPVDLSKRSKDDVARVTVE